MITTETITTEQFLNDLFGSSEALIYFNTNGKSWKDKPQTYAEAQPKLDYLNHTKQCDVYFIPNSGGTKDSQINQINSVFIDWDAGKDSHGNYFPIEVVAQKKQEFLQLLARFPYKSTYIIETRNGFHVYWFLYPGTTSEQFISVQKALIKYFNSDPKVCNPARVMRLPIYYAYKSGKYDPFLVSIIEHNEVIYSIETLISYLGICQSSSEQECSHLDDAFNSEESRKGAHNNTYINNIYTRSIIMGTYSPSSNREEPIKLSTMEEVVDYISKQNIADYLNYETSEQVSKEGLTITCPFHSDETPSASIYYHENYCYLKCHSKNCSFETGTLIQVVQKKDGLTEGEAVKKLMEYYYI